MILRVKAGYADFVRAVKRNDGVAVALEGFLTATERWQKTHGYENQWRFPKLNETLMKLKSQTIKRVLDYSNVSGVRFEKNPGATQYEWIRTDDRNVETYTLQLIAAMRQGLEAIRG